MFCHISQRSCAVLAVTALISGCDGSGGDGDPATSPITLSGPLSSALAAADQIQPSSDGTISVNAMLAGFPAAAMTDFAARFPNSLADEQYRRVSYNGGVVVAEVFGIEGENAAETAEVSALYRADGSFVSSVSSSMLATVPANVTNTVNSLYPGATVTETQQRVDENGAITYAVDLDLAGSELDLLLDSAGALVETAQEIAAAQAPAAVVTAAQQELAGGVAIEYEQVTNTQAGSVVYEAELDHDIEGVELSFSDTGQILSMTFEQEI